MYVAACPPSTKGSYVVLIHGGCRNCCVVVYFFAVTASFPAHDTVCERCGLECVRCVVVVYAM